MGVLFVALFCVGNLVAATPAATTAAMAGDLYQWKDANGVTHYSQTPPASGSYKERTESGRDTAAKPVEAAAANG